MPDRRALEGPDLLTKGEANCLYYATPELGCGVISHCDSQGFTRITRHSKSHRDVESTPINAQITVEVRKMDYFPSGVLDLNVPCGLGTLNLQSLLCSIFVTDGIAIHLPATGDFHNQREGMDASVAYFQLGDFKGNRVRSLLLRLCSQPSGIAEPQQRGCCKQASPTRSHTWRIGAHHHPPYIIAIPLLSFSPSIRPILTGLRFYEPEQWLSPF